MQDNIRQQLKALQDYLDELGDKLDNAVKPESVTPKKIIALTKRERQLVRRLRKTPMSITQISQAFGIQIDSAYRYTHILKKKGVNITNENLKFKVN